MATQIQTKNTNALRKASSVGLAVLPVLVALYTSGFSFHDVPTTIISGVYPMGFTILSWTLAVILGLKK